MMIKKTIAGLTLLTTLLSGAVVFARNDNNEWKDARKQRIEEMKDKIKDLRHQIKDLKKTGSGSNVHGSGSTVRPTPKPKTGSGRTVIGKRAQLGHAMITSINGMDLNVMQGRKSYTVHTGSGTTLKRRFGADAKWSEFAVNQYVDVKGTWADEGRTQINATWIKNWSIQKRNGVFNGVVSSLTGSGFVLSSYGRGNQSVFPDGSTQIVNRRGVAIMLSEILVNHRLTVRGVWDRTNHTVTEVTHIKDRSLPTGSGSSL